MLLFVIFCVLHIFKTRDWQGICDSTDKSYRQRVTGSSPVSPTIKKPLFGAFFAPLTIDYQFTPDIFEFEYCSNKSNSLQYPHSIPISRTLISILENKSGKCYNNTLQGHRTLASLFPALHLRTYFKIHGDSRLYLLGIIYLSVGLGDLSGLFFVGWSVISQTQKQ